MPHAIIFDDGKGKLSPMTDLRAAFALRTGALTTVARLANIFGLDEFSLFVPDHLAAITREAVELDVNVPPTGTAEVLLVNGRCAVPPVERIEELSKGGSLVEAGTGDVIAAKVGADRAREFLVGGALGGAGTKTRELPAPALLSRPWHFRTFRDAAIEIDLAMMCAKDQDPPQRAVMVLGEGGLKIREGARVFPGVVLDTEHGSICIGEGAVVRPGSTIIGPAFIGPGATISDRAVIKGFTSIGPHCKVGGEVGGCIFQGFSNKVHDGHLGDSWIGEWVNLGAATTNSNLLNTYDQVICRALPDGPSERTGEMFLGCILGDHVKTAISTRIMTGAIAGTGTMYAATAPMTGTIPPFSWITDAGTRRYRLDKFTQVAKTMMARRKVTPSKAYLDRLAALIPASMP
jgi:UDP-N-acetylglucosamine diphosphorylase/glucosamine-1-phosphate N-acetyltransferase